MALGTFVAGPYTATYYAPSDSARSLGIMEQGYNVGYSMRRQILARTDTYGETPIEGFYQGAEVNIQGTATEWLAGVMKAINPYNTWNGSVAAAAGTFSLGQVGKADTDNAGVLVLTATAGTPASASPATLTATLALLAENFDVSMLFGPEHRKMPWRFRIYPYLSTTVKFFTPT